MSTVALPLSTAYHLIAMIGGINTAWEVLMTGFGVALWVAVAVTVYRLARFLIDRFRQRGNASE